MIMGAQYQLITNIVHTATGQHLIKGFLALNEDEEFDANNSRHMDSAVAFICWNQMLQELLKAEDGDAEKAIVNAQRTFRLKSHTALIYMRDHAPEAEVSEFVAQVDDFIKISILLLTC